MSRLLTVFAVGLVAGAAVADIPPPKGLKRVTVIHKITTDKDIADYAFFTNVPVLKEAKAVKFDAKTPIEINEPGLLGAVELVAVPKETAKKYDSDKALAKAVAEGKVDGLVRSKTTFFCRGTAKDTVKGDSITMEYALDKIDGKAGIVLTAKKEAAPKDAPKRDAPKDGKEPQNQDEGDEPDAPLVARGGPVVAGSAAALALVFGGLWVVGRGRRKV